jgi:2'-5' RNA ligase
MTYEVGQTALVVVVTEAEAVVQPWWGRYNEAARYGMPPHVTVLFPFLRIDDVDVGVIEALAAIAGAQPRFDVEFGLCARFPGVLYLRPDPDTPFRRLTAAVVSRWPQAPPYGGQFDDVTPHLTIAHTVDPARFDEIEADVVTRLPLRTEVTEVQLLAFDDQRWTPRHSLPLGSAGLPGDSAGRDSQ